MKEIKEIVEKFVAEGATTLALRDVMVEFLVNDVLELQTLQGRQDDQAIRTVFDEVEKRFGEFAKLAPLVNNRNKLRRQDFGVILKVLMPGVFSEWQRAKARRQERRAIRIS